MSQALTISDDLYAHLKNTAQSRGVSIEELLRTWQNTDRGSEEEVDAETELRRRRMAVKRIATTRAELIARYGEMPDSTDIIREDRAR